MLRLDWLLFSFGSSLVARVGGRHIVFGEFCGFLGIRIFPLPEVIFARHIGIHGVLSSIVLDRFAVLALRCFNSFGDKGRKLSQS